MAALRPRTGPGEPGHAAEQGSAAQEDGESHVPVPGHCRRRPLLLVREAEAVGSGLLCNVGYTKSESVWNGARSPCRVLYSVAVTRHDRNFSVPLPLPLALIFRAYKKYARHCIAAAVTPTHRLPPYILYPIHTGTNCRISIVADRLLTHWTPKHCTGRNS